ncbi:MAG: translocator protein [Candidatus Parcubacteria bacterium]|nr:translocator protein [Candidatus Parcubacteria bacterium]
MSISEVRCETGERGEARLTGINGHTYCVFISQEGAAGSIYTNYFYVTEKDNRSITLDLTLQAPQCANYDDPQKTECERERESFNVDDLADRILQSVDVRTLP